YNSLEPGDTIIVGVAGFFSGRIVEIAQRCDAKVVSVNADWGQAIPPEAIEEELKRHPEARVVALVHCETSTGVLQPLAEIGRLAHEHGAMFLVDSVASMGGHDIAVDSLLVAAGRSPNVEDMGLEQAGVEFDQRGIKVDDRLRTTNPRIFAAGDVASKYQFTHAADFMARMVIGNALFFGRSKASALTFPWATYHHSPAPQQDETRFSLISRHAYADPAGQLEFTIVSLPRNF
ncbi:MAG: aminotransferase class V-fold PLP-dependent enzyme, partial [Myxococcales bacterium]|nr:aminotransferase class V-fold PLP-dependent enzyme [Myxococcales bacterium]